MRLDRLFGKYIISKSGNVMCRFAERKTIFLCFWPVLLPSTQNMVRKHRTNYRRFELWEVVEFFLEVMRASYGSQKIRLGLVYQKHLIRTPQKMMCTFLRKKSTATDIISVYWVVIVYLTLEDPKKYTDFSLSKQNWLERNNQSSVWHQTFSAADGNTYRTSGKNNQANLTRSHDCMLAQNFFC